MKLYRLLFAIAMITTHVFSMTIYIRTPSMGTLSLEAEAGDSIENIKALIQDSINIPPDRQELFYGSYSLDNGMTLSDYNIPRLSVLDLVLLRTISERVLPTNYTSSYNASKSLDLINDNIISYPSMSQTITVLNSLTNDSELAMAVEGTTPVVINSIMIVSSHIPHSLQKIVEQRQNNNFEISPKDNTTQEKIFWVKPFGSFTEQKNKNGINGFNANEFGLAVGFDKNLKNGSQVGVSFFCTNIGLDVKNMNQDAELKTFATMLYGTTQTLNGKINFLYQLGYIVEQVETNRKLFTNENAISGYTSFGSFANIKILNTVNVSENLTIQPMLGFSYNHYHSPAFNESGAESLNLNVDGFTINQLATEAGYMIYYKLDNSSKIFGYLNAQYILNDYKNEIYSSYEGANDIKFATPGINNNKLSYDVGVGYEKNIKQSTNISASYNLNGDNYYKNHLFSMKYIYNF